MKKSVKKIGVGLGISGFTLGVVGIYSILFMGVLSLPILIVGLVFSIMQQKRNPTKLGKIGIYLNIIGMILVVVYFAIMIKYIMPYIQQLQAQGGLA